MGPVDGPMAQSESNAFKFPKLNGENYSLWDEHMQAALQSRFLWLIVSGMETCPALPTGAAAATAEGKLEKKEHLNWLLCDQAAQRLMKGATESSQWPHISKATTAMQMWNTWRDVCDQPTKHQCLLPLQGTIHSEV